MARTKASDEIFCRSCGDPIKKQAEICPNCGVKNNQTEQTSSSGAQRTIDKQHDPSNYTTTVSEDWYYAVAGSVAGWILTIAIGGILGSNAIVSIIMLLAWVAMPVGIYFDSQYIRANGKWNPNTLLWAVASIIWIVNIVVGAVYLYRRHEVLGTP